MQERKAPDGTVFGEKIPGSRFYRVFCLYCGEPMRSDRPGAEPHACEVCNPFHRRSVSAARDETGPWQDNAIKALEGE